MAEVDEDVYKIPVIKVVELVVLRSGHVPVRKATGMQNVLHVICRGIKTVDAKMIDMKMVDRKMIRKQLR
jgi:hypothetical protein